jgi:transposase-like protein
LSDHDGTESVITIHRNPHRQVKYLNNNVESDHGKLKQVIRPMRGFKTVRTALK